MFRKPIFTVIMALRRKSSDAGSASKAKRNREMLSISENVNIPDVIEMEKESYVETVRLYVKNGPSIRELMKVKKISTSFSVAPQTTKVTAIKPDIMLMKLKKTLNFWVEDMNRKRIPLFITLYYYFNVCNVLMCVIYQLNLTVFMYVTRLSRYITLYIAFGIIRGSRYRGRSWNVLPAVTGVHLYIDRA